jgi:hypothetical protein
MQMLLPQAGKGVRPSMQHFKFCRFGLSLGILIFSILDISFLTIETSKCGTDTFII